MKRRAVVGVFARELHEVADMIRREVRPEIDDDGSRRGVNDRLLAGHLGQRERSRERSGRGGLLCRGRSACVAARRAMWSAPLRRARRQVEMNDASRVIIGPARSRRVRRARNKIKPRRVTAEWLEHDVPGSRGGRSPLQARDSATRRRVVREIRPEPALGFLDRHPFALRRTTPAGRGRCGRR